MLMFGMLCYAAPAAKDTVYTNVKALMNKVRNTKKRTATYYLVLKNDNNKDVKVRIDLKQIDCEIPLYKSQAFDIKKLMALKDESLTETKQKLADFDVEAKKWIKLENEAKTIRKELNELRADSTAMDTTAIADLKQRLKERTLDFEKQKTAATKLFNEYEVMMTALLGNLRNQYKERLTNAMKEAYRKIENQETRFLSVDDDAQIWDIRLDLLKLDAKRPMKISRRKDGGGTLTEDISVGKEYYIMHFAEFGTVFEEDKVKRVFSAVKLTEFHMNPYLMDKQFGLVCDDQDRTQHYINSIVNYKDYNEDLSKEKFVDNNPLKIMKLRKESYGNYQEHVGKYGCVRTKKGRSCSHPLATYMFLGKNKPHMGIDLLAIEGTEIFSAVNGIAYLYPREISGYGKVVSIKGKLMNLSTKKEEEIYILYAHLKEVKIKDGETVKVGDVIGQTGRSGNANGMPQTEEHLHLEILTQKWPSSSKGFSIRKPPLNYFLVIN